MTENAKSERREHGGYYDRHIVGRSQIKVTIDCPFCKAAVVGFLWSIAGGGKKCKCGAVIRKSYAVKNVPADPGNTKTI